MGYAAIRISKVARMSFFAQMWSHSLTCGIIDLARFWAGNDANRKNIYQELSASRVS